MVKRGCIILLVAVLFPHIFLKAQTDRPLNGVPGIGSNAVVRTVTEILELDRQTPPSSNLKFNEELKIGNRFKLPSPDALPGNSFPYRDEAELMPLDVTQSIHSNFQGINRLESNITPPDCMGAVSHTQICVLANGRIKWYTKPTVCDAPLLTSTTTETGSLSNPVFSTALQAFFGPVHNNSSVTDPHVYFDRISERWFVVAINMANASNRILIAVSSGPTITNQASFSFYFFNHDNGAPANNPDIGAFSDYPMPGLDKHALYIGSLIFNASGNYTGSSVYVVNKASLLAGGPLTFSALRQAGLANTGIFAPQGVHNDDPEATRGFFMGVDKEFYGRLSYIVVNNPGTASPTFTKATINAPATFRPYNQPSVGATLPLDALDDRLFDAQMMKNKYTGQKSIWTAHTIAVNSNGTAVTADGVTSARNAMRWYQITDNNGALLLTQSGTLFDNATTNPKGYWMGTIMSSGQGHAVLASSVAAPNLHANAVVAGRYASQSSGVLNPPVNATNFSQVYNLETAGSDQRWGDYSHTVVDPSDDMTLWTFQEYTSSPNIWAVRVIQLKAPPPAVPTSVGTIACDVNKVATITLNGSGTDFAGFFDPGPALSGGPAYLKRLDIASTGNVSVSNIELINARQVRFRANFSNATLGSAQTLTITNPDCQFVTFGYTLPATCTGTTPPTGTLIVNGNPVTGDEMVVTTPEATGELRLLATDGKLLEAYKVSGGRITIPVRKYPSGIYFVEFVGSSSEQTIKIFIDRQ